MSDRVKSGNANLKGLMQNSNMMVHPVMYPSKLKGSTQETGGTQNANKSVNTHANNKEHVAGK